MSNDGSGGTGGCQCGAIRFRLTASPRKVYACHCSECRRQSASAFGISVIVPLDGVVLERGEPSHWHRPTDSGGTLTCAFCPTCGSRLWHIGGADMSVKGGALDIPPTPTAHIWLTSKVDWMIIPDGAERWDREPEG